MPPVPSKKPAGSMQVWASITSLILPLQVACPWECLRTTFTQPLGSLASWPMFGWRASPLALVRHVDSHPMYAPVGKVACLVLACPRVRPPAFGQPPPLTPCGVPALAGLTLVCALRCITSCRPACTSGHTTSPGWKAPHLHAGQDQTTHHAQPPPLLPATSAAPAQASVAPPLNSPT